MGDMNAYRDGIKKRAESVKRTHAELKRKASAYDRLERYLSNIEADVSKYAIVTTSEIRLILEGK